MTTSTSNQLPPIAQNFQILPGLPEELEYMVLSKLSCQELQKFIQEHPYPAVWKDRFEICRNVFSRKESMTVDDLKRFQRIFSLSLQVGPIKSWSELANDPKFSLPCLRHLELSHLITIQDLIAISKLCPNLTSISLGSFESYGIRNTSLALLVQHFPKLTSINLGNTCTTDASVQYLAQHYPNLTSINLFNCPVSRINNPISDAAILALANHCPKLSTIELRSSNRQITDAAVQQLTTNCPLTSLSISETSLANVIVQPCPHLTSLDLWRTKITDATLTSLAKFCPNLTSIQLGEDITAVGLQALGQHCPNLNSISKDKFTDNEIKTLCEHCPNLTEFATCDISDAGVEMLAKRYPNLTKISLPGCRKITNASVQHLAKYCPKLTSINLQFNSLTDRAFANTQFPNLVSIFLAETQISARMVQTLLQNSPKLTTGNYGSGRYVQSIKK